MKPHSCFFGSGLFPILALVLLSLSAHAATLTWNGGTVGQWDDPTKWQPQQVPGAGDTAVIGGTQETIVAVTGTRSVDRLVLDNPNATLRVVETITSGVPRMTVAKGFENHGTIELGSESESGNLVVLTVSSGTLTNAPGGVLRATASGGRGVLEANLDNRGGVEATAGLILRGNLANSGTVHVPEGQTISLQFHGFQIVWTHQGGSITGTGTVQFPPASGSRLELETDFVAGAYALDARGLTVNGPGKLLGPVTGKLLMNQWTVNADLVVSGDIQVEGSTRINGRLSVLAGKTLRVVETITSGVPGMTVAKGFENHGTIELGSESGSGNLVVLTVSSGTLTNAPGGVLRATASGGRGVLEANLDNRGGVEATAGLILRGNLANSGTVHVPEGQTISLQFHGFQIVWTHQGGSITGTGTVQFPPASGSRLELETDFVAGAYALDARGLTVNGPGKLLGPVTGKLLMNQWTVNADLVVSGDIQVEGSTRINGRLSVLAGKTLRVVETITSGVPGMTVAKGFENHGTIELGSESGSGNLVVLTVSSGTLTNAPGGVLRATVSGGRGVLEANLDNRGGVEATAGLILRGNLANSGTVHVPEGQTISLQFHGFQIVWTHQGGSITGTGTVQFPPASGSRLELETDFVAGAYALDARGLTVNGPGKLLGPVTGEFLIRDWTINAAMDVKGDIRISGDVRINSALSVAQGKTLRLTTDSIGSQAFLTVANGFENHGTIELRTGFDSSRVRLTVSNGTLTNVVGGIMRSVGDAAASRQILATLDNRGTLVVEGDLSFNGSLLNTATGVLAGTGTYNFSGATVTQEGTVAPGTSPGVLSISGNLPHGQDSRFEAEIGGFTAGTQHDQLKLENPVTLGGAIRPVLIDDFFPKKDDAFTVLTYPSRTGTFAALDNPLPERIAWEVRYGPTSAQLVVLNTAPTVASIAHATINELTPLSVTASATDQDLPAQTLTFSLAEAPAGMTIHPTTGAITWTPTEAQGPGTHNVTVRVTDNGTPSLGHTTSFTVTVHEVNVAPQLALPSPRTAEEQAEMVLILPGTDADLPSNALVYEMVSGPAGATFNAASREFRWTPTEEQGPGSFTAAFRVTDNNPDAVNAKQLSTDSVLTITVNEVNRPPLLAPIPAATVHAGATFAVTLSATDTDIPANAFTYALVSGPAGATVSSQGQVAWTPPLAADGSVADFIVRVTEDGVPSLSDDSTFQVTVVGPVEILGTTRQGAEWTVLWRAVAGSTYRLVGASALPAAEWTAVAGEVTATGNTASMTLALGVDTSVSFLRVERVR